MKNAFAVIGIAILLYLCTPLHAQGVAELAEHIRVMGIKSIDMKPSPLRNEWSLNVVARLQNTYGRRISVDSCQLQVTLTTANEPELDPLELGIAQCSRFEIESATDAYMDVPLTITYADRDLAFRVLQEVFNLVGNPSNRIEVSISSLPGRDVTLWVHQPNSKSKTGFAGSIKWYFTAKMQRVLLFE
jgi:hypothetical protein